MPPLFTFVWKSGAMMPLGRFASRASEEFKDGEYYKLEVHEERSWNSHKHYFASLHDLWLNLPETAAMEPWAQSYEHLRKYALIKTGWNDSQTYACTSQAEAQRWALNMRPLDEYAIVIAQGPLVVRYTAKTQSMKAMGKDDFQASKDDVLGFCESLVQRTHGAAA